MESFHWVAGTLTMVLARYEAAFIVPHRWKRSSGALGADKLLRRRRSSLSVYSSLVELQ